MVDRNCSRGMNHVLVVPNIGNPLGLRTIRSWVQTDEQDRQTVLGRNTDQPTSLSGAVFTLDGLAARATAHSPRKSAPVSSSADCGPKSHENKTAEEQPSLYEPTGATPREERTGVASA